MVLFTCKLRPTDYVGRVELTTVAVLLLSIEAILRVHQPIQLLQEGNEQQWLTETEEAMSGMLPEFERGYGYRF